MRVRLEQQRGSYRTKQTYSCKVSDTSDRIILPCKAKSQYLLTLEVRRYCLLALQRSTGSSLTSSVICLCSGLSISHRARVPGEVRLVRTIVFLGLAHHCTNRSREKADCRSGVLTSTTWKHTKRENKHRKRNSWGIILTSIFNLYKMGIAWAIPSCKN